MIEARASKRFQPQAPGAAAAEAAGFASPVVWLNLLCLDAPLVAVTWFWFFARALHTPVIAGSAAALFLTAWLIYLADRLGDSLSVDRAAPTSTRQAFCLRHRRVWVAALAVIAVADLMVVAKLPSNVLRAGIAVGAPALLYLVANQMFATVWRRLPLKEVAIGFLFASGVFAALTPQLTNGFLIGWFLFGCLCVLNCISIAVWERKLDLAQGRISIATEHRFVARLLGPVLISLAVAAAVIALPITLSALLLLLIHLGRNRMATDTATALADLVLLTPLLIAVF